MNINTNTKLFYGMIGIIAISALFIIATGGHKNTRGDILFSVNSTWEEKNDIENFMINISNLELGNDEENITATLAQDIFDLAYIENRVLASAFTIEEDFYSTMRFDFEIIDDEEELDIHFPGKTVEIEHGVNISAETNTVVEFNFLMDESLFMSTEGDLIFLPVIKISTVTNTRVAFSENEDYIKTDIRGGSIEETQTIRINEDGNVVEHRELETDTIFEVHEDGRIERTEETPENLNVTIEEAIGIATENTDMEREGIAATNLESIEGAFVWQIDGVINEEFGRVIINAENGEIVEIITD